MKVQNLLTLAATAALITSGSASITMDWIDVGNPGNAADESTGYGAVAYAYKISKYEVTNAQYGAFLNAKGASNSGAIYSSSMTGTGITQTGSSGNFTYSVTSGFENKPVVYVSWFDAARFANWMMNGQGSGDMESGAYTLNGATSGIITANIGAQVYLPSEDEWYKAAYYSAANESYSLYPNGQNTISTADANYGNPVGSTTNVGTYSGDPSSYGTFDQGGNVWEWNDAVISGSARGLRGGSFNFGENNLRSSDGNFIVGPSVASSNVGFRVASVPEPTSMVLTMLAGGVMLARRKR
jgi:formylglycine-generating enzyme required for sulfatase activity